MLTKSSCGQQTWHFVALRDHDDIPSGHVGLRASWFLHVLVRHVTI